MRKKMERIGVIASISAIQMAIRQMMTEYRLESALICNSLTCWNDGDCRLVEFTTSLGKHVEFGNDVVLGDRLEKSGSACEGLETSTDGRQQGADQHYPWMGPCDRCVHENLYFFK